MSEARLKYAVKVSTYENLTIEIIDIAHNYKIVFLLFLPRLLLDFFSALVFYSYQCCIKYYTQMWIMFLPVEAFHCLTLIQSHLLLSGIGLLQFPTSVFYFSQGEAIPGLNIMNSSLDFQWESEPEFDYTFTEGTVLEHHENGTCIFLGRLVWFAFIYKNHFLIENYKFNLISTWKLIVHVSRCICGRKENNVFPVG